MKINKSLDKFDAIVVGGGPAGTTAAIVLAKNNQKVLLIERGIHPGSKNIFGGVLYSTILNEIVPEFWKTAPIERRVTERSFSMLSSDSVIGIASRTQKYNTPPFNHSFTILRSKFDKWYAKIAKKYDVIVANETVAQDLIWNSKRTQIIGLKTDRGDELLCDTVICADGVNSLLAKKAYLRKEFTPESMILCVKEILRLPSEIIQDRFNLEGDEGVALEYLGESVGGLYGSGFIYSNKQSLSIGVGCLLSDFTDNKKRPFEVLEKFKKHPEIKKLIRGSVSVEYSSHMIPEYGYNHLPKMYGPGIMLIGDAAGLVNTSIHKEGTNLAMASGKIAAETFLEAKSKRDFGDTSLSEYKNKLEKSFVLKDMKRVRNLSELLKSNREIFDKFPKMLPTLYNNYFNISNLSKREVTHNIFRTMRKEYGIIKSLLLALKMGRAFIYG